MLRIAGTLVALLLLAGVVTSQDETVKRKKKAKADLLDVKGQLLDTDPVDAVHRQPCKLYTVNLKKEKTYVIDLESSDFDAFLRLESSKGDAIAEDDDGGGDLNSQIIHIPDQDGGFKIVATRLGDDGKGAFRLRVRELKYKANKPVEVGENGLKIDAKLTMDDAEDMVGPKHRYKLYSVKMTAGRTYTIDLESSQFDAFLRLHDGKFRKLAEDDDGGNDLNSRIVHRATADGVYHIIATTFDGEVGDFTLKVREEK
jgi:hypothetical protein